MVDYGWAMVDDECVLWWFKVDYDRVIVGCGWFTRPEGTRDRISTHLYLCCVCYFVIMNIYITPWCGVVGNVVRGVVCCGG